jgi:hypothetical protein
LDEDLDGFGGEGGEALGNHESDGRSNRKVTAKVTFPRQIKELSEGETGARIPNHHWPSVVTSPRRKSPGGAG